MFLTDTISMLLIRLLILTIFRDVSFFMRRGDLMGGGGGAQFFPNLKSGGGHVFFPEFNIKYIF